MKPGLYLSADERRGSGQQVPRVTAESARRTEMIQANAARESSARRMSRPEFLASLGLLLRLREVLATYDAAYPRAFELLNKTSQFNTTGRRWTQEELRTAFACGTVSHTFEVEDLFSHYGLVGVIIAGPDAIEQIVMSCRVVGMDVEIATRLVETEANLLCRDLFERCAFTATGGGAYAIARDALPGVPADLALDGDERAARRHG